MPATSGSPVASSNKAVGQWVSMPTPRTVAVWGARSRTAAVILARHADGSAPPGPAPRAAGCGTRDRATTVPSEARMTALVADVPTSIPRYVTGAAFCGSLVIETHPFEGRVRIWSVVGLLVRSVEQFGSDLGAVTTMDDGLQRSDHLAGIRCLPNVSTSGHPVRACLDDGGGLLEHVEGAVGGSAASGHDDGRRTLDDLRELGGGAGVPGLDDVGTEFRCGARRIEHRFGGTLSVTPHLAGGVGVAH